MYTPYSKLSTGLNGLDRVLQGLLAGDNIVWQVDNIEDYRELVQPYCEAAVKAGHRLVYFRFAAHPALLDEEAGAEIHAFDPSEGFETFIANIHAVIEEAGRGAFYVFDCLSELAVTWHSDQMLANFFMLTCPYLFDLETITYFALFRNYHSVHATRPIADTTQLLLDVYRHQSQLYVRPLKVQHRYSPTMNLLHVREGEDFAPVTASARIAEIMTSARWSGLHTDRLPGFWEKAFVQAQQTLDCVRGGRQAECDEQELFERLSRMVFSRDEGILALAMKYLKLEDIVDVRRRMIGTGLIGGKTVGMLLARAILKQSDHRFRELLEEHDSFYIGSDVFYTFLVRNGIWWTRQQQRDPSRFLEGAERARRLMLTGSFPDHTLQEFEEMLDYFGQSPFIVRSSSLLEDNFGNAFAGKYESVFCANQGPRQRRLEDFMAAVRTIYASTLSEKALTYRSRRGLLEQDEQMALLVMRVSGDKFEKCFYPAIAGVGFSFNPYAWNKHIDPEAGVMRLVFGLGTRAVDRADDDYTRVVALNAPDRRPEADFDEVRQYAQRRMDYLDLEANQLVSGYFVDVAKDNNGLPMDLIASMDRRDRHAKTTSGTKPWVLTFDGLLQKTDFVEDIRRMLAILTEAYDYPVDIEFTANFVKDMAYRINLVQCRPLQIHGAERTTLPELTASDEDTIIRARGAIIGHSRVVTVDRFIYVVPSVYSALPVRERYEVARAIGDVNRKMRSNKDDTVMLIGPGRWGTRSPELGVPVAFSDINHVSILCEIVAMREDLVPDVSLGTHFLSELVEMDMLYLALFPGKGGNDIREEVFTGAPNRLAELVPSAAKWGDAIRVVETEASGRHIDLVADAQEQRVICCYRQP